MKNKPLNNRTIDFLIIGAMKSGTTAVAENMNSHPEIFIPESKEPSYFINWEKNYLNGREEIINWKNNSASNLNKYLELFDNATKSQLIGEASTLYLPSKDTPRLAYDHNPKMKIIVILRNPISRAISAHNYNLTNQKELEDDFIKAAQEELDGKRDQFIYNSRYLYYGLYYKHVKNWLTYFPQSQIKILKFSDLKNQPSIFYDELSNFLKIESFSNYISSFDKKYNKSVVPKGYIEKFLWSILEKPYPLKMFLKNHINNNLLARYKKKIKSSLIKVTSEAPKIEYNSNEFIFIKEYFQNDLNNLNKEFGITFDD